MSSKLIKFELNSAGVRELLQSREMQTIIDGYAQAKAKQAGQGYEADTRVGEKRAYANIYPVTVDAAYDNLDNNTLEKVIRT